MDEISYEQILKHISTSLKKTDRIAFTQSITIVLPTYCGYDYKLHKEWYVDKDQEILGIVKYKRHYYLYDKFEQYYRISEIPTKYYPTIIAMINN